MTTKAALWITGIRSPLSEMDKTLHTAGYILARGPEAALWLKENGISHWEEFQPEASEDGKTGIAVYLEKAAAALESGKDAVYITATVPMYSDSLAAGMIKRFGLSNIRYCSGQDLLNDGNAQSLLLEGVNLCVLDGLALAGKYHLPVDPGQNTIIYYPNSVLDNRQLAGLIQQIYPADHGMGLYTMTSEGKTAWQRIYAAELADIQAVSEMMVLPSRAADSSLVSFEELIAHLRAPNGCPWDRKQTHDSLRKYLLEETYEALDALDQHDMDGLCEELGDIVLQIALHAQIAVEDREFNMAQVLEGINRKIVFRHPHVFGDVAVDGVKGVLQNWEKLKEKERAEKGKEEEKGLLDGIPQSFPALAQAQAIQDRAARVGFDWKEIEPVMAKVLEEFEEVQTATSEEERAKELGDLLFAVVNLVRWYKVDAESALRGTNQKFRRRFSYIEKTSKRIEKPMQEMSLEEMDSYWDEAKKEEKD